MTSDDDAEAIWGSYAKGVKKLHSKEDRTEPPTKPKKRPAPLQEEPLPWPEINDATPPAIEVKPPEPPKPVAQTRPWKKEPLDPRVERNMSLGDVFIEAKLDLHGRTEQEAYNAFVAFIEAQQKRGKRMLLVITGKGGEAGTSVLRANLPRWCTVAPFDDDVLAVRTAAPHHGGDGAYYVLLRKGGKL